MWNLYIFVFVNVIVTVLCSQPNPKNLKDQYCTDPRTMKKHGAYTEWADAYSCTRHRCQPGGRNLAIYTVGCKKVEPPESAIECEEVVEDTNMQFPYCCTRLRCLVVVRGEVWTRVIGQPWEQLPAAPWSHMYKMKKPPPGGMFERGPNVGPVYELGDTPNQNARKHKAKRRMQPQVSARKTFDRTTSKPDFAPLPDGNVVSWIPDLSPYHDDDVRKPEKDKLTKKKTPKPAADDEEEIPDEEPTSDKSPGAWTEPSIENTKDEEQDKGAGTKPRNLKFLVDAIGSRMRDIEHVVQKMNDKVDEPERRDKAQTDNEGSEEEKQKKEPSKDSDYKRFSDVQKRAKYIHVDPEATSEKPLYADDAGNGYYSDASHTLKRKETLDPNQTTYMAPVEPKQKQADSGSSGEGTDKHHHKRHHRRRVKPGHHRKHRKDTHHKFRKSFSEERSEDRATSNEES